MIFMSVKEAVEKQRAKLFPVCTLNGEVVEAEVTETAEAAQAEEVDPLESILGKEKAEWLKAYRAELESNPAVQKFRQDLVSAAVKKERENMGFPPRNAWSLSGRA
jgi:hypothetical protein